MKVSSSKEKILKKIREALSNPVPLPFPKSEGITSVFKRQEEDLEMLFAEEFTKLLGKFAFCMNDADLKSQLKILIAQKKWDHLYCVEKKLSGLFEGDGFPKINQTVLADCDVSVTSCKYLIARTGAIVMSSDQESGRTVSVYAPVHICIAYVDQLVFDTRDSLKLIKEMYVFLVDKPSS
jgi:L-lactate dehydrogenase complex protein LldG